jgi:cob(I)alamin adenosyltransferase
MGNRLSKIVTRTGDDGTTGLGDGSRVAKHSARIEVIGTVDELNSAIGLLRAAPNLPDEVSQLLLTIQHDLFDLGGEYAVPGYQVLQDSHVSALEAAVEQFNDSLPPLKEFILPGGGEAAARCHLARTIARRGVSEPAVGSAVRRGARAGTPRSRQRSAVESQPIEVSDCVPSATAIRTRAARIPAAFQWRPCRRTAGTASARCRRCPLPDRSRTRY